MLYILILLEEAFIETKGKLFRKTLVVNLVV